MAGDYGQRGVDAGWALVDGDRLVPVPIPDMYPRLSIDGRIVYWWSYPTADSTRVVTWDTETNQELASRDLPGNDLDGRPRSYLAGIDEDGMAYWVDESSEIPVTRWDVRADTLQPMPDLTSSDMPYPHEEARAFFQNQFVSPDGTKEMFTPDDPGDTIMPAIPEIWVRPVGSEDPSDMVKLRVPESRRTQPLYDFQTSKGTLGVWWETNETVLVTAMPEPVAPNSCAARSGTVPARWSSSSNRRLGMGGLELRPLPNHRVKPASHSADSGLGQPWLR